MTIDLWWVVVIGGLCFVAGIAVTLVAAAFIVTTPTDDRIHLGELPPALRGDP